MSPKTKKVLMWVAPVIIAGVIILVLSKKASAKNKKDAVNNNTPPVVPSVTAASTSVFPLKKGSKNSTVKQLQNALITAFGPSILPKYGADGDWGSETEAALTGKGLPDVINSQTDLNNLLSKISTIVNQAYSSSRAVMLVNDWGNRNDNSRLSPLKNVTLSQISVDAYGAINKTGKALQISANTKWAYPAVDITDSTKNGMIIMQLTGVSTGMDGTYLADPTQWTLL